MAIEAMRGCGYRKVGGLYLCGEGLSMACDRLPYELGVCPVCGGGVKFTRGWTWLDWAMFAGDHSFMNKEEKCGWQCPVCHPEGHPQPYGLLWVGEQHYTPESFIQEALQMGVSKRIAAIPRNLKLGETWVLFAHKKAVTKFGVYDKDPELGITEDVPGVFYAFRPQRLELLIWQKDATEEKLAELEKRGITPIIIPDRDIDHNPGTSLKPTDTERNLAVFKNIRTTLGR